LRRHAGLPSARASLAVTARAGDHAGHLVGLERRAADEAAVDRMLGQELADVGAGDAAAVQDRHVSALWPQPRSAASVARIASAMAAASALEAVRPVPIAQTGS
jgi:hypothetical protein